MLGADALCVNDGMVPFLVFSLFTSSETGKSFFSFIEFVSGDREFVFIVLVLLLFKNSFAYACS